jgi:RNA-directed DNA polymerase
VAVLQSLKDAQNLEGFAKLLGYKPSALAYILYKLPDSAKYHSFTIPKASGGERHIDAPLEPLKTLQRRLATLLYDCVAHIEHETKRTALSHGFRRKRSIITNARQHRNRRYVFNLDLADFFPTFNFGRVRGYFIKNADFALPEKVATLIAQIACRDGKLPQGSPCSPIIADLITHILDVRLARIAKQSRATYSRYADDLTFSTNRKEFAPELAFLDPIDPEKWLPSAPLLSRIEHTGFIVNPAKTRMQFRGSRQTVTGLVVNRTVNIRAEYYKSVRSMCHSLFMTGRYHRPIPKPVAPLDGGDAATTAPELTNKLAPLEGMLNHVHYVKNLADRRDEALKKERPTSARRLYRDFLFYKSFVALNRPLLICEGKTDNIYLRHAMRRLTDFHPTLGQIEDGQFKPAVGLFRYTNHSHDILRLGGGSGDIKLFIQHYARLLKLFTHLPLAHPVILLIDNDNGANGKKGIFSLVNEMFGKAIRLDTNDNFYRLASNLYLVKTPEKGKNHQSCIEDLFDKETLNEKLGEKVFNKSNTTSTDTQYGKYYFAEKVVQVKANSIDFSGFNPLLQRIVSAIEDYSPAYPPAGASATESNKTP